MRPATLAETVERIRAGQTLEQALPEFLDEFYLADSPHQQISMLSEEPAITGDARLDALAGAVTEYLARRYRLDHTPGWCFGPQRYLTHAWHASPFEDNAFREYLTFASPAEFSSRNIFTEERPLQRARSHLPFAKRSASRTPAE